MLFIYSLILTIKDLFKYNIKKYALYNGIFWLIIWLLIAIFTWNKVSFFTTKLISIFPYSFIQISGSYIIFTLLWIQLIFLTIGIFYVFFNDLIEKKISKNKFDYISIIIGIISILFWSFIFLFYKQNIINFISHILKILPFQTVDELLSSFLALLFFYLLYSATISFSFLIIFHKKLIKIAKNEYPSLKTNKIHIRKIILISLKDLFIYIILAILLYPLMLIPFLNILLLTFIWAYMIKESYYNTINMLFEIELNNKEKWLLSILSVFLNFLPIINIFAPLFGILSFMHYGLEKKSNKY